MICLVMGSVSAADTNSTQTLNHNADGEILTVEVSSTGGASGLNELENRDNTVLSETHKVGGNTFQNISNTINKTNPGDTILLNGTYEGNGSQISINTENLTIIGTNNCILDAQGNSRIFNILTNNITIKNITFINGNAGKLLPGGGAILWGGNNGHIVNCSFISNTAGMSGGAVFWNGYNGTVDDCTFASNNATGNNQYNGGGLLVWSIWSFT